MTRAEIPPPDPDTIRASIRALPVTPDGPLIHEKAALAAFYDLEIQGSAVPRQTHAIVDYTLAETDAQLDKLPLQADQRTYYVIPSSELRSLMSRAAIHSTIQALYGTGISVELERELYYLFDRASSPEGNFEGGDTGPPPEM